MPLYNQVFIIYAGTNGYLDDLPVSAVRKFESELYAFMADKYPDIAHTIERTGAMDEKMVETLKHALDEFKGQFTA